MTSLDLFTGWCRHGNRVSVLVSEKVDYRPGDSKFRSHSGLFG